ncbi:MAG: hypothetical protein Q4F76_06360, partial [Lachnospiraceae bacterium]|nr:hypothetical protein [Lachnospiraceae bacterium]
YEKTEKELCGQESGTGILGDFDFSKIIGQLVFTGPGILPITPAPVIPAILSLSVPVSRKFFPLVGLTGGSSDQVASAVNWLVNGEFGKKAGVEEDENPKAKLLSKFNGDTKSLGEATKKLDDKISKFKNDYSKNLGSSKKEYDTVTKTWETIDETDKKAAEAFDKGLKQGKMDAAVKAGVGVSAAASIWEDEASVSGKYGHASAKAYAGKAEASAEGYAGLYQRNPTTGEFEFKPGIGGSIGASVTAFSAEEEAVLGGDMLGVYAKSSQTIGRAGVKAEGSIGLFDAEGELNPSAYVGVRGEAIAGEITGAVGGKILGTDVGVSGSLNYGIGAHANVGFHDGKVSLDVGATLGVGASVKLEVDIGGTISAVYGGAKAAWTGLQQLKFW